MSHHHHGGQTRWRTAFLLTAIILVVELSAALLSHSLALFSDAGHVLTDLGAIGLAWFATAQAARPANEHHTYGYHRIGILAALANAVTLIVIVGAIALEAIRRFQHPQPVAPGLMLVAAAVGIALNLIIALGLRGHGHHDLNVRAATLHVLGDVAASVGVIAGAAVILFTRWYAADPLISLLIALLIARGAWDVLREAVDVLLESAPRHVDVPALVHDMADVPGIQGVHDLHVWSVAGGMCLLSAHVQMAGDPQLSTGDEVILHLNYLLRRRYNIAHATIQLECIGCQPNRLYCELRQEHQHEHSGGLGLPAPGAG